MSKRAIFISYSWEEEEHQEWVKKFSDDLQTYLGDSYEILLDQNLPKGFPLTRFMEMGINKAEKVLIIGTPTYRKKSQNGKGVAFEHSIISNEMLGNIDTTKYYPILRKGSFTESFPSALNGRIGDDLSNDKYYEKKMKIVVNAIINDNPIPDIFKQDSTVITFDKVIEQQKGKNQKVIEKLAMTAERSIASLDGVKLSEDKKKLIFVPKDKVGSFIIPNSVNKIGDEAFRGCTGLTSIVIPNSVTEIGILAFRECTSLTSINIPNRLKEIPGWSFRGCTSLTSIKVPGSVTKIGKYAFSGCRSLTSIEIPNSVTEIGDGAFHSCKSLTSIWIHNSVTEIGWRAFYGCTNLVALHLRRKWFGFIYNHLEDLDVSKITLYVPKGEEKDYRNYYNRYFGKIVAE